jgi:hypothetical protein
VTSAIIPANFGSALAADAQCRSIAQGLLGGTWASWTSDSTSSAASRLEHADVPYVLVDGVTVVAANWTELTSGTLQHGIDMDENKVTQAGVEVWTGTDTTGGFVSGETCSDWTTTVHSTTVTAEVGISTRTDSTWTAVYLQFCDYTYQHLYCIEQAPPGP